MSDILMTWLNTEVDLSKKVESMEEDFSNGYLLGELLYKFNQLTNIKDFNDGNDRKSRIKNFNLLYDVFRRIKVDFTPSTAENIMNCKRGEIPKLLYKIRSKLEKKGVSLDNLSIKRSDHLTALYSSMKFTKEIPNFDIFNKKFFNEQLQKKVKSQKETDLEDHLSKFERFKEIQIKEIHQEENDAKLSKLIEVDERRKQMKSELARFHAFQQQFEQRGIDDWKRNMISKKEIEKNDLNFQLREAEKYQKVVMNSITAGEITLKKNISQFEKNMKMAAAEEMNSSVDTQITGYNVKHFKKVIDFSDKMRECILQRIMNDQATKTERSRRRRKIIVEQSKAQFEIENRRKEDQYVQKLYKQSNQEKQLSYETFRVMQIKNVIIENRNLRQFMYGDRKVIDTGNLKETEVDFLRFHIDYFNHELDKEEHIRKDLQIATRQKIRSTNTDICKRMTDLIIDIAEEAYVYQQTNDTDDIDPRVWREWTQLFINDQPLSSGALQECLEENLLLNKFDDNESNKDELVDNVMSPYMMSNYNTKYCQTYYSAYTQETGYSSLDKILDDCQFYDYINFLGQWSKEIIPNSGFVTINLNDIMEYSIPSIVQPTGAKTNKNVQPQLKATEEQHKEEDSDNLIIPKDIEFNPYFGDLVDNLIDIKYGEEAKIRRNMIFSHIPVKIALIGADFAGKKTQAKILSENYPFKIYNIDNILKKAFEVLAQSEFNNEINVVQNFDRSDTIMVMNLHVDKLTNDKEDDEKKYERIKELASETRELLKLGEAVPDRIYVDLLIEFIKIDFPPKKEVEIEQEIVNRVKAKEEILEKLKKNEEDKEKRPIAYAELEQELNEELMRINLEASKGFVIVNFPNTQNQAKLLENKISSYLEENEKKQTAAVKLKENFALILDKSRKYTPPTKMIHGGLDYIFLVDISPQECIRRAFGRRTLASNSKFDSYQTIHNYYQGDSNQSDICHLEDSPPETNHNLCERLIKIEDIKNSESSLVTRRVSFENTINSLIDFYEPFGFEHYKLKLLNNIDGQKNKDAVTQDLIEYLNKLVEMNEKRDRDIAASRQDDSEDHHDNISRDNFSVHYVNENHNMLSFEDEEYSDGDIEEQIAKQKKKFEFIKSTLNKDLCEILVKIWSRLFANYLKECKSIFKFLRLQRDSIGNNFNVVSQRFIDFLKRPSKKQILLLDFQLKYNKFMDDYPDLIDDPQVKEEHHQEVDDLNDKLFEIIESRKNEAIEERKKQMTSSWIENEMEKFYLNTERLYQAEIDKFLGSVQMINDYYHNLDNRPLIELPLHTIDIIKEEIDPTPLESENDTNLFPKIEKLYKTALKVQFQYDEALVSAEKKRTEKSKILRKYNIVQEANKKVKPVLNKKGQAVANELEEKKESYPSEEERKLAIKNEKAKYRYRVTLIKYWGIHSLKNMRKIANTIYNKFEDWIILSIKAENDALTQLTNILKSHIEKEKKIKYELELDTFDILINMDVQNFIELPPKSLPAKEIIDHFKFNISQLKILIEELKPYETNEGIIRSSTLIEILLKKYISSRNDNDVYYGIPTALKKLSFQNYYKFIKHLDANHSDFINVKHLGTYFSLLNCVVCSSNDETSIKEQCRGDKISRAEFVKLKMWFDRYEESPTLPNHENFNRAEQLKEIMFDLNKEGKDVIDINEICKIFTLRSIHIDNEKYANKTYYQVIFF